MDSNERAESTCQVKRQAVVIIHGIGEQRPMDTLRGFVDAFRRPDEYYSKPDRISNSFELRRIKLRKTEDEWPDTDFFEYYWAHRMSGTLWSAISAWFFPLLWRLRRKEERKDPIQHERLPRLFWFTCMILTCVALIVARSIMSGRKELLELSGVVLLLTTLLLLVRGWLSDKARAYIGDAARYLHSAPTNVSSRYDIIRGGVDLLEHLHKSENEYAGASQKQYTYDRIVVIGHSLGSVIAYDMLKHYWNRVGAKLPIDNARVRQKVEAVEHFKVDEFKKEFEKKFKKKIEVSPPFDPPPSANVPHEQFLQAQHKLWWQLCQDQHERIDGSIDRSPLFGVRDLKDVDNLLRRLNAANAAPDLLSQHLRGRMENAAEHLSNVLILREQFYSALQQRPVQLSQDLLQDLIQVLNHLLQGECLYNEQLFAGVTLTVETRNLIEKYGQKKLQGVRLVHLNRLLLEEAYPEHIEKRQPKPAATKDKADDTPPVHWIVTDFITLGSPLSYGTLLLADSVEDFKTKVDLRELPACPPDRSRNVRPSHFTVPLSTDIDATPDYHAFHHGAPFAVTRWTNLYFPGDPVGGRVGNVFGPGVLDICLNEPPKLGFPRLGLRTHTRYWHKSSKQCLFTLKIILTNPCWSDWCPEYPFVEC